MMKNTNTFDSIEILIAKKIQAVLSPHNYDVVFVDKHQMFHIYKNFSYCGEFEFQRNAGSDYLVFKLQVGDITHSPEKVYYGKQTKDNYLFPFFDSLESAVQTLKKFS